MRNDIAQFDEVSLYAFGLDRVTVQTLRNIVRIVGTATQGPTIPEVAEQAGGAAADVVILRALVEAIEAEAGNPQPTDNALLRRLAEIEAQLESVMTENTRLTRRVAELETGAN